MKLGQMLQKTDKEMYFMLKRTNLLEKKKKRKAEVDKMVQLCRNKVECDLKM